MNKLDTGWSLCPEGCQYDGGSEASTSSFRASALASSTLSPDSFYLLNPFSRASLYLENVFQTFSTSSIHGVVLLPCSRDPSSGTWMCR